MMSGGDTQTVARRSNKLAEGAPDDDAFQRAAESHEARRGAEPDTGLKRTLMRTPNVLTCKPIAAGDRGTTEDDEMAAPDPRRGILALNRSPLARRIVAFNLLAILVMLAGLLYLNRFPDDLVLQREAGLATEARLIARALELHLDSASATPDLAAAAIAADLPPGTALVVIDPAGRVIVDAAGPPVAVPATPRAPISDLLRNGRDLAVGLLRRAPQPAVADPAALLGPLLEPALAGETDVVSRKDGGGRFSFAAATPIMQGTAVIGAAGLSTSAPEIKAMARATGERILQISVIAVVAAVALGLILAASIANPLSDLAAAAETGGDRQAGRARAGADRVRIPDLTDRPDEIGRLSGAIRGMVTALYDRIDGNDQFTADVAHEIRNPLASLRSAVSSLRLAGRPEQRVRLLDVIEHDVRRLDRLLSDIANASRLESDLVREEEEVFDLIRTLGNLTDFLSGEARARGVDFVTDLPAGPVLISGLEARLAQVFVNLLTNAISFCEEGDAVRLWARRREDRVLVVVEDTGPGIPEGTEEKIFARFYSERPEEQFGEHSGLGLAISKQIVEVHGGVIWAENIRPTDADITSEPLGARFVVGLPV